MVFRPLQASLNLRQRSPKRQHTLYAPFVHPKASYHPLQPHAFLVSLKRLPIFRSNALFVRQYNTVVASETIGTNVETAAKTTPYPFELTPQFIDSIPRIPVIHFSSTGLPQFQKRSQSNRLLKHYLAENKFSLAEDLAEEMKKNGLRDYFTFTMLITHYKYCDKPVKMMRMLKEMLMERFLPKVQTWNHILHWFASKRNPEMVVRIFLKIQELQRESYGRMLALQPATFYQLILAFSYVGNYNQAINYYQQMQLSGIRPNVQTYKLLIDVYGKLGDNVMVDQLVREMFNRGFTNNNKYSALAQIGSFSELERELKARKLAEDRDGMRDIYIGLMSAYSRKHTLEQVVQVFQRMQEDGIVPNVNVYNHLLLACAKHHKMDMMNHYYQQMKAAAIEPNKFTFNVLMNAWRDDEGKMLQYYQEMQGNWEPDMYTYSTLVAGFSISKNVHQIFATLESMVSKGFKLDLPIITMAMKGCGNAGHVEEMMWCYNQIFENGLKPDEVVYLVLLDVYSQQGNTEMAEQYFRELLRLHSKPNRKAFEYMMNGFATTQNTAGVLKYYNLLKDYHYSPTTLMLKYVMKCFGKEQDFESLSQRFQLSFDTNKLQPLIEVAIETRGNVDQMVSYFTATRSPFANKLQ